MIIVLLISLLKHLFFIHYCTSRLSAKRRCFLRFEALKTDVASKSYGYFNAVSCEINAISMQSYHWWAFGYHSNANQQPPCQWSNNPMPMPMVDCSIGLLVSLFGVFLNKHQKWSLIDERLLYLHTKMTVEFFIINLTMMHLSVCLFHNGKCNNTQV